MSRKKKRRQRTEKSTINKHPSAVRPLETQRVGWVSRGEKKEEEDERREIRQKGEKKNRGRRERKERREGKYEEETGRE